MKTHMFLSALILLAAALPKASAQSAEEEAIKKTVLPKPDIFFLATPQPGKLPGFMILK